MKSIKIMKKFLFLIFCTLFLFSCKNLINENAITIQSKSTILKVKITTTNSRIAMPELPPFEELIFESTATKDEQTVNGVYEDETFTFALTEGIWLINISAKIHVTGGYKNVFQGTKTVNIPPSGKLQEELKLDFIPDAKGSINLQIMFDSSSIVKKIRIDCEESSLCVSSTSLSISSYVYTKSDIPQGEYDIYIYLLDVDDEENEHILAVIPETVIVKANFKTETWI